MLVWSLKPYCLVSQALTIEHGIHTQHTLMLKVCHGNFTISATPVQALTAISRAAHRVVESSLPAASAGEPAAGSDSRCLKMTT